PAALLAVAPAMPAHAFANNAKSFVSAAGSDANDCSFAHPCATMARAVGVTFRGGMVSCLDGNDSTAPVTITQPLTIDCRGTTAGAGPFIIDTPGITVVIKNVFIFSQIIPGITFNRGAALIVEDVHITDCPVGINFAPSNAGAVLSVSNSLIRNNAN